MDTEEKKYLKNATFLFRVSISTFHRSRGVENFPVFPLSSNATGRGQVSGGIREASLTMGTVVFLKPTLEFSPRSSWEATLKVTTISLQKICSIALNKSLPSFFSCARLIPVSVKLANKFFCATY